MSDVTIEQVKDFIKNMSLMDAAQLVKDLEDELGVTAAAPVAMVAGGAPGAEGGAGEEKSEFDLVLEEAGQERVKVIKVVRELTGLGLKEAKELVDSAPKPIKESLGKDEAEEGKKKLEEVGAKAALK